MVEDSIVEVESGIPDLIRGSCNSEFKDVAEIFARNFSKYNEIGASLCIVVDEEIVVDIWAGHRDKDRTKNWDESTLSVGFSSTKAALSLCAHLLIDRGELDPNEKVTKYWPEYGKKGKKDTTVMMMLNHSAGLPALKTEVADGGFLDWDYMVQLLENEEPFWIPGEKTGYHMITFGWLVGELVRRVSGKSLGTFFDEELREPYNLDYWIGLPESEEERVTSVTPFTPGPEDKPSDFARVFRENPQSMQRLSLTNTGSYDYNAKETHRAELAGVGGITDARSLAGLLTPLAQNNEELLSKESVKSLSRRSVLTEIDEMLLLPTSFSAGFMLNMDNRETFQGEGGSFMIGPNGFGHVGYGGSSATFADPDCKMSFGYLTNRLGGEYLINERAQSLIDSAYLCLRGR